jgi:IS30 family transposase
MKYYSHLSQEERYHIAFFRRKGYSVAQMAQELGRHRSSIYREMERNKRDYDGWYRAESAQSYYQGRRRRSRKGFHHTDDQMKIVFKLIRKKWSPEQVSNVLRLAGILSISHETIYKHILHDKKNGGTLFKHLRIMPKLRRKRYNSHDSRGRLQGKRMITERPKEIDSRETVGHWEGDTVYGRARHHSIVTLTERKSGTVIIKKIKARTSALTTKVILKAIRQNPGKFNTITFDNG